MGMSEYPPYLYSSGLGFGIYTNLRQAPEGFEWIQGINEWLYLRDEFGRLWYVNLEQPNGLYLIYRNTAGIWDWIRTLGRLKPGQHYADHGWTLYIPNRLPHSFTVDLSNGYWDKGHWVSCNAKQPAKTTT
jgi:hypothetical protein